MGVYKNVNQFHDESATTLFFFFFWARQTDFQVAQDANEKQRSCLSILSVLLLFYIYMISFLTIC
jgi:hypothetical protein